MSRCLWELARLFLKLGTVSFGGPAAHIAAMEDEIVHRRQWLSRDQFLDLLAATYLIPGPNALEMAAHVGYRRAGLLGSLLAAASFTLPAALITGILAWAYDHFGALPQVEPFLRGIKPAVLAIIFAAIYRLGKTSLKNWQTGLIGVSVVAAALAGLNEIATLLAAGLIGAVFLRLTERKTDVPPAAPLGALGAWIAARGAAVAAGVPLAAAGAAISLWKVGLFFLKIGAVLYGSGYVLVAYLQSGLVGQHGWLTEQQLVDAVAAGQVTPGPLITTATFVGYLLAGPWGAAVATVAIVLPGLILVILTNPWISRLRSWPWSARFLDAVNAASIGLTAAVVVALARSSLVDWRSWLIAAAAALAVLRWKAPFALLVLGGGVAGLLLG
jgi:chromate transporter